MSAKSTFNITEPLIAKVAALAVTGLQEHRIAVLLNEENPEAKYNFRQIKKVIEHPKYKNLMEELSRSVIGHSKTQLRQGMAVLVPKIVEVIKNNLDKNNLKAVMPALKILGFDTEEETKQAQAINVILPGAPQEPKQVAEDIKVEIQDTANRG